MLPMPTAADLLPLLPELVLVAGAFALLMLDLFLDDARRAITWVGAIALLLVVAWMSFAGIGGQGTVLSGMFVRDTMSDVLNAGACVLVALALVYAWPYLRERGLLKGEVAVMMLFATLGMMLLVSAGSLVMVYLGLEMLALSSYALVAIDRDNPLASEAAMKYFVLGSLASGLLLYGMSLLYGATGTLDLATLRAAVAGSSEPGLLLAGTVFMIAGIAFKFGAAPFHMWVPDTYQGAPTPITLFLGSAPELASFALAFRLLENGVGPLDDHWRLLLAGLAAASLVVGNLVALMQANLKRMLAYSAVSHIGFVFLGLAGGNAQGYAAAMFYVIVYAIMSAAAFGAIIAMSSRGFEADRIDDFKGLNQRDPWLAGLVLCVMFSMAGIPPFLGFWAKLAVLRATIQGDLMWLAIVGIVFAVIGCFYYLRVVKAMYFDPPPEGAPAPRSDRPVRLALAVNALALLVLGLFWNPLMAWCLRSFT
ncbi:NADH-quinone oxidoreductase subunit NuoN [Pseudoluteimonas lycopersici]|uniref:NADH-quinone oxidoreductase subunit N n=1 Tax=Pseudoluteimonas lycopersici TaxID=1324796 RepID=A0A516V2J7_9GAMM|nr:NADH-quinone oxidoreductase subunit NuoN [Lysobacter lycopersici]QDQ72737.1 NADH-quinone oxidoreductase subunit NuoN [Lysobacter lycopersici]